MSGCGNEEPFCLAFINLPRSAADEIERLEFVLEAFRGGRPLKDIAIGPGGGR